MTYTDAERFSCDICGRFVPTNGGDQYGPWGGSGDLEPPEPIDFCEQCAEGSFHKALANFRKFGIAPYKNRPYYVPPKFWLKARAIVKSERRHGLILPVLHYEARHETKGVLRAWFCKCGRPEAHPAHDPKTARACSIKYCRFERRVERSIANKRPLRRYWCTCGWSTPWVAVDVHSWEPESAEGQFKQHVKSVWGRETRFERASA